MSSDHSQMAPSKPTGPPSGPYYDCDACPSNRAQWPPSYLVWYSATDQWLCDDCARQDLSGSERAEPCWPLPNWLKEHDT